MTTTVRDLPKNPWSMNRLLHLAKKNEDTYLVAKTAASHRINETLTRNPDSKIMLRIYLIRFVIVLAALMQSSCEELRDYNDYEQKRRAFSKQGISLPEKAILQPIPIF